MFDRVVDDLLRYAVKVDGLHFAEFNVHVLEADGKWAAFAAVFDELIQRGSKTRTRMRSWMPSVP